MSRSIEVSDATYEKVKQLASASRTTPAEWVAAEIDRWAPVEAEMEPSAGHSGLSKSNGSSGESRNSIELSDDAYTRIEAAAAAAGITVAEWVAALAPRPDVPPNGQPQADALAEARTLDGPAGQIGQFSSGRGDVIETSDACLDDDHRTMADVLAKYLGSVSSGGLDAMAARPGDPFSDYLIEKKRNGCL